MNCLRLTWICIFWGWLALPSFGQYPALTFEQPEFLNRHLTLYQYTFIQDQEGFLWIGGPEGLVRYDGYSASSFTFDPDDTTSLSSNEVSKLIEGPEGALWVGTGFGGVCRFDKLTESFERFTTRQYGEQGWLSDEIYSLYFYRDSLLLIGSNMGLSLLEYEPYAQNGVIRCHPVTLHPDFTPGMDPHIPQAIHEDIQGNLWVGGSFGLTRIPREEVISGNLHTTPHTPWLEGIEVWEMATGANGDLWVATENGLLRIPASDLEKDTATSLHWFRHSPDDPNSLSSDALTSLLYDSKGDLWIGTRNAGISILPAAEMSKPHPNQFSFLNYAMDPLDPNSISANQINAIYEDRTQNIWICTYHLLNKVYQLRRQFNHTYGGFSRSDQIWDNIVFAIYHDPNEVTWIGTKSGLSKYDPRQTEVSRLKIDDRNSSNPRNNAIRSILPFGEDSLWIASLNGLWVFNIQTSQFTRFAGLSNEARQWMELQLFHAIQDQEGNFWIGSREGLFRLDPRTAEVHRSTHDPDRPGSLSHAFVRYIFEDPGGNLWIGTSRGLDKLSKTSRDADVWEFEHFRHAPDNPNSLSNDEIRYITGGEGGSLWIGTDGGGFNQLFPESGTCLRFNTKQGLSNDVIYAILPDNAGNLWISTNYGISKFNPETRQFTNYDVSDGLQGNEFNVRAAYRSRDGELFFGGINGFNHFYPEDIVPNQFAPEVRFTGLRIQNQWGDFHQSEVLSQPITFTDKLVLDWRDDIFSLEVAAMEFSSPQQNQFQYQMEGFSDQWIPLENENKITFTGLSPGSYTLSVLGSNNDGIWSEKPAQLQIRILPPFWRTWWAYALYVLTFAGLVTWLVRLRIKRIRLENALVIEKIESEKLREIERVKSDFLANVSHELRTPLTLISGQVQKLKERTRDPESRQLLQLVANNSQRLLRMINQLLEAARLEANQPELNLESVDLRAFFSMIHENFTLMAAEKEIHLEVKPAAHRLELTCDREKLEHIFYNLLSNALKFTPKGGTVSLSWAEQDKDRVLLMVEDTGVGIPQADQPHLFERFYQVKASQTEIQKGTGLGLSLVREFVQLHGGTVKVESEVGKGTRFLLEFPRSGPASAAPALAPKKEEKTRISTPASLPEPAPAPSNEDRPTLLIVEDNPDLRRFIRMEVADQFHTLEAANGEEGLQMAKEHIPDLIITDLMMPKMDGTQLCKQVKTELATSHIPLIMLTARASDQSRITGLEAGADDYLTKPFNSRELQLRIRNMLRFRDRLREQFIGEAVELKKVRVGAPAEDKFLTQVMTSIESHLDHPDFSVEDLAESIGLGRKQLQRKLKAVAGQSPNQFIRNVRLDAAKKLLADPALNVSEVGYQVGFSSPSYFAKCFQERFGTTPKAWRE